MVAAQQALQRLAQPKLTVREGPHDFGGGEGDTRSSALEKNFVVGVIQRKLGQGPPGGQQLNTVWTDVERRSYDEFITRANFTIWDKIPAENAVAAAKVFYGLPDSQGNSLKFTVDRGSLTGCSTKPNVYSFAGWYDNAQCKDLRNIDRRELSITRDANELLEIDKIAGVLEANNNAKATIHLPGGAQHTWNEYRHDDCRPEVKKYCDIINNIRKGVIDRSCIPHAAGDDIDTIILRYLDLKRGGDYIQTKVPGVFVSQDRMAIIKAAIDGRPVIHTYKEDGKFYIRLIKYKTPESDIPEFRELRKRFLDEKVTQRPAQDVLLKREILNLYFELKEALEKLRNEISVAEGRRVGGRNTYSYDILSKWLKGVGQTPVGQRGQAHRYQYASQNALLLRKRWAISTLVEEDRPHYIELINEIQTEIEEILQHAWDVDKPIREEVAEEAERDAKEKRNDYEKIKKRGGVRERELKKAFDMMCTAEEKAAAKRKEADSHFPLNGNESIPRRSRSRSRSPSRSSRLRECEEVSSHGRQGHGRRGLRSPGYRSGGGAPGNLDNLVSKYIQMIFKYIKRQAYNDTDTNKNDIRGVYLESLYIEIKKSDADTLKVIDLIEKLLPYICTYRYFQMFNENITTLKGLYYLQIVLTQQPVDGWKGFNPLIDTYIDDTQKSLKKYKQEHIHHLRSILKKIKINDDISDYVRFVRGYETATVVLQTGDKTYFPSYKVLEDIYRRTVMCHYRYVYSMLHRSEDELKSEHDLESEYMGGKQDERIKKPKGGIRKVKKREARVALDNGAAAALEEHLGALDDRVFGNIKNSIITERKKEVPYPDKKYTEIVSTLNNIIQTLNITQFMEQPFIVQQYILEQGTPKTETLLQEVYNMYYKNNMGYITKDELNVERQALEDTFRDIGRHLYTTEDTNYNLFRNLVEIFPELVNPLVSIHIKYQTDTTPLYPKHMQPYLEEVESIIESDSAAEAAAGPGYRGSQGGKRKPKTKKKV